MMPCAWCEAPTTLRTETVAGRTAVRGGEQVWIAPITVPCCQECRRMLIRHRAQVAQARYIRHAQVDAVEQLHLDV